jgi:hypothetical protein
LEYLFFVFAKGFALSIVDSSLPVLVFLVQCEVVQVLIVRFQMEMWNVEKINLMVEKDVIWEEAEVAVKERRMWKLENVVVTVVVVIVNVTVVVVVVNVVGIGSD